MLFDLPSEIIYHIALHLPTANALAHLAQTCRRLHGIITAENSRIFQAFVQSRFPSIKTPPFWKDAAQALASRSRALDRNAIVGRFVVPPETATKIGSHEVTRRDNPTLGYRPAIDSYEIWNGQSWADRKEVLAWGAANQVVMRIKQTGARARENWIQFNDIDHISSYDDICSLHLLSSEERYQQDADTEHLIFGRLRGDIAHLAISPSEATYEYKHKFLTYGLRLDKTDLSNDTERTLAAHFENGSIALFHSMDEQEEIEPFTWFRPEGVSRNKYSKLLSSSLLAVGTGEAESALSISTITPDGVAPYRTIGADTLETDSTSLKSKVNIGCIEPLNRHALSGSPGDVFLTAWDDYTIRLHDLRSPAPYEVAYKDVSDLNPIYSLHAFGHNHFLAGAGGEAIVKLFDLRMCNTYSYLDAQVPVTRSQRTNGTEKNSTSTTPKTQTGNIPRNGFSMFLSHHPPPPFPHQAPARNRQRGQYRGPIYTISSPSPSSPTVYTGVVDGIVRLDFASTDDLTGSRKEWYEHNLDLGVNTGPAPSTDSNMEAFNLAGYERPDADDFSTTSKLRNQRAFWDTGAADAELEAATGWDRRWEHLEEPGAWRRHD
jgi:WD40 repeat protein